MTTKKSERIGIVIIMVVLLVGAVGSYVAMALSVNNQSSEQSDYMAQYQEYLEQQKEAGRLNAKNSEALSNYSARKFDASDVKSLAVEVLTAGSGDVISSSDTIKVSYFGWTSDGIIFDSSKKIGADDKPVALSLSSVIQGWTKGIAGQKVGSIVRLSIPSDQAYGSSGSGIIPADAPLEFIVQIHSIETTTNA